MKREDVLQAYAQAIAGERDKPEASAPTAIAPDTDVEKLETSPTDTSTRYLTSYRKKHIH